MSALTLSRRQGRVVRGRQARPPVLNLVSLMDIFTILVFFLMVNSSDVEVLETSPDIRLPDSAADQRPPQNVVVSVDGDQVVLQGAAVASVAGVLAEGPAALATLEQGLRAAAAELPDGVTLADVPVTIMGDRDLPYALLKHLVASCQEGGFQRVALAVNQVAAPGIAELGEPLAAAAGNPWTGG